MKLYFSIISILVFITSHSQLIKTNGKKWNSKEILGKITDSTVYFLDTNIVQKDSIKLVKPNDIATITAYFEDEPNLPAMFKDYLNHGAIAFVTKQYAISKYRPGLSEISNDYYELTKAHSIDRDSVMYIIDGDTLKPNVEGKLMNIDFKTIDKLQVIFPSETQKVYGDMTKFGIVFITSRKL